MERISLIWCFPGWALMIQHILFLLLRNIFFMFFGRTILLSFTLLFLKTPNTITTLILVITIWGITLNVLSCRTSLIRWFKLLKNYWYIHQFHFLLLVFSNLMEILEKLLFLNIISPWSTSLINSIRNILAVIITKINDIYNFYTC